MWWNLFNFHTISSIFVKMPGNSLIYKQIYVEVTAPENSVRMAFKVWNISEQNDNV